MDFKKNNIKMTNKGISFKKCSSNFEKQSQRLLKLCWQTSNGCFPFCNILFKQLCSNVQKKQKKNIMNVRIMLE